MTLKPIPGAPPGAPIPDFPAAEQAPLAVRASGGTRPAVARWPGVPPSPAPAVAPQVAPTRPGPVEIRGHGETALTFRVIPEVPAINRASLTISITGEPTGDYAPRTMPHLDLATDAAKAFLLALRDGASPVAVADSRTALQVEFVVAADGAGVTVSKPGWPRTVRRFDAGRSRDVQAMAARLLAELGP